MYVGNIGTVWCILNMMLWIIGLMKFNVCLHTSTLVLILCFTLVTVLPYIPGAPYIHVSISNHFPTNTTVALGQCNM